MPDRYRRGASHAGSRAFILAAALLLLAVASAYVVAGVAVRLDQVFFPGNDVGLPAQLRRLPGLAHALRPGEHPAGAAAAGGRINLLVLGLDRRPWEPAEAARTDSMFVLTLDPATRTSGVLSIPRDLWVRVPDGEGGFVEDRINTAYRYGSLNAYGGGGLRAARDTVEHNFPQIRIDYVAAVDFASFIRIVDALGGIDVWVEEGFRYRDGVTGNGQGVVVTFQPGLDHMDGTRALQYVRFREAPDGDLGRIRRQQQVLLAVADRLLSLDGSVRAADLWGQFRDAVETDIPAYRVPGIALLAKQIGPDHVTMRSLGDVARPKRTAGGADVLVADPLAAAALVGELFADPRLHRDAARVEIQNGTARTGLARAAANSFIERGLLPSLVTTANSLTTQDETVVLNLGGKDYTAQRIADWLGLPRSRIRAAQAPPSASSADIVVILGRDARVPSTASAAGR